MKLASQFVKLVALAAVCTVGMLPRAAIAEESSCQARLVPIALLVPNPGSTEYPLPTCKSCEKLKLETQSTASGVVQGVLTVLYHHEEERPFDGAIELTVVLTGGAEHLVYIENVMLSEGEEAAWVVDEEAGTWGWDQVELARMELVAG